MVQTGQSGRYVKRGAREEALAPDATWRDGARLLEDTRTGLCWEVKSPNAEDFNFSGRELTWEAFYGAYIRALNAECFGGFDDWRAPLQAELRTLIDYRRVAPAFDRAALDFLAAEPYWCGPVSDGKRPDCGWVLHFNLGAATLRAKELPARGLAVRGARRLAGAERFHDNGDGTVLDTVTRLQWQKGQSERRSYQAVQAMLRDFELAGYRDWRLPSLQELTTIFDESYANGSWYYDEVFACDVLKPPILQHITSDLFENSYVWVKNFHVGYDGYYADLTMPLCYRLVRDADAPRRVLRFRMPESGQRPALAPDGAPRETGNAAFCFAETESGLRDENTGLCYAAQSPLDTAEPLFTYEEALAYVERLNAARRGGCDDWRLPTCDELRMIVSYAGHAPAVAPAFAGRVAADFYWTGEAHPLKQTMAWAMYLGYGCAVPLEKRRRYRVLAVRGGYRSLADKSPRRYLVDEETATDTYLGKMWMRAELPLLTAWEAETYLREQKVAGFDDWRLPDMKELSTLVRRDCPDGSWFDTVLFPDVNKAEGVFFLAAETFNGIFHWGVNLRLGYDGYYADRLQGRYRVKAVRNV